jgi:hypothetical protein
VRPWLYLTATLVIAVAAVLTSGASAARANSAPTTFTIAGGALSITTPSSANLGTAPIGTSAVNAALGTVTVSDQRALFAGGWTASVISGSFVTGSSSPAETVPAADVSYAPGSATATSGTGTFTPGAGGALGTSRTAFTASAEAGITSCGWNPTITVTLPAAVIAGTYTGTITHSVA